ncbi:hypothetical protein D918_01595 [Trichuris suis]|nr:hypothetical protein D918_01595 [Trichuris suis]
MYKCKCPPGVTGLHCQIILDICELRSPCDLGECVLDKNSRYGYYCICPPDKRGWQCELPKYSFFGLFYMTRTTYVALWTGISSLILAVVLQAISMGQSASKPKKPRKASKRASRKRWQRSREKEEFENLMQI